MKSSSRKAVALAVAAGMTLPSPAFATNGYFLIGFGAKSRGMGGVGVAYGQDGLAAAANPAAMADVKMNTMRVDVGAELFNPPRAVKHRTATLGSPPDFVVSEKSGSNLFLIPSMGGIYKFNKKLIVGMAAIGAGSNTRYNQEVPGKPNCVNGDTSDGVGSYFFNFNCNADSKTVGVNLMQMQMLPSVAYRVKKNHYVGASLALAVQVFRAYGLGAFQKLGFAGSTEYVSGEGNDWSYGGGIRLGYLGKFMKKKLTVGVNWASRVYMSKFDKYRNLFAEQGSFDIPSHYAVGIAYHPNKKLTIAADIQRILYSTITSINNPGPNVVDLTDLNPLCPGVDTPECLLGGDKGMGFGWKDQTVYKLGINYDYNKTWSFRAGLNYGTGVIPSDQVLFNMLAPATVKKHITLGLSYRPNPSMEWSVNYMHAFKETIKGPTNFPPPENGGQPVIGSNAAISMYINSIGVSFAFKM